MNEYYLPERYVHQTEAAALIAPGTAPVRAGAIQGQATVLDLDEWLACIFDSRAPQMSGALL